MVSSVEYKKGLNEVCLKRLFHAYPFQNMNNKNDLMVRLFALSLIVITNNTKNNTYFFICKLFNQKQFL